MRVHAIQHNIDEKRYLINLDRVCNKPPGACDLTHVHVFTDDELANRDLMAAEVFGAVRESDDATR